MGKFKDMLNTRVNALVDSYRERLRGRLTRDQIDEIQSIVTFAIIKLRDERISLGNPELERPKQKIVDDAVARVKRYLESILPPVEEDPSDPENPSEPEGDTSYLDPGVPIRGSTLPIQLYPREGSSMPRVADPQRELTLEELVSGGRQPTLGAGGAGRRR